MQTLKHYFGILILLLMLGCNVSPQAIDYGNDGCYYCKMTIVDKIHAAEIVTNKGKVYKFDAAECMLHFMEDFDESQIKLYLTNSFTEPETLIDATKATYIISKNIPSPMGAYLSAFKNEADAKKIQSEKGGELYTWQSLLVKFKG